MLAGLVSHVIAHRMYTRRDEGVVDAKNSTATDCSS
jgi:hypothetical protein